MMFIRRNIIFIAGILLVITLFGCREFQEEEFAISSLDAEAYALLQDSLSDTISTFPLMNFDTSWVGSVVYDNVPEILDSLEVYDIKVYADTSYTIITPEDMDTNYIFYQNNPTDIPVTGNGVNIVFFFNDYLNINLIGENGTLINEESNAIPPETIADCPELKTRIAYTLEEEKYLVELIKGDQTLSNIFRTVIFHEQ
ncbi:MAG: hypothetical protein U9R01_05810 [candidate division WOR-3 bacterium]|nr:hypothetical protein [candidate division WOR-3 bacterium]